MPRLFDYRIIFVFVALAGSSLIVSPFLVKLAPAINVQPFSEFYILGPGRMASGYTMNVVAGANYGVTMGIVNHLESSAYYSLQVKLRNQAEQLPDQVLGIQSPLPSLYEKRVVLGNNEAFEAPLNFTFKNLLFSSGLCMISTLSINGQDVTVNKIAGWNSTRGGYFVQLFVELWTFDRGSVKFAYDKEFVSLWLNMTGS